ncbi:glycerate kinase [Candidatus Aerophobetes bacterium]|uniref:Glycerate kinase n=1 Tax=Aerophobetes bacterium TaxID=2030807 RepID=A0A523UU42_UNCAE|nr:MAG: glycerate kinase [Candidatus Aerophobetes bacterium]
MPSKTLEKLRKDARKIFMAGVERVEPARAVKSFVHLEDSTLTVNMREYDLNQIKNIYIVGAGKAAAPMALAVEEILGNWINEGLINTKYGHGLSLNRIELKEAGHPLPDEAGMRGAETILSLIEKAKNEDLIICLISGGGSALLPLPAQGISLEEKQEATSLLLGCGATIQEINAIRKHISRIKGGRLAEASWPAQLLTLILSDVVGDPLDVIASGPTVPDESTFADCLAIVKKYKLESRVSPSIKNYLHEGAAGRRQDTPKPGNVCFTRTQNVTIGSNIQAIGASASEARQLGYHPLILSSLIEGETRQVAKVHAAIAKEVIRTGNPITKPACLISGGETTVTLRGEGRGGRNQEFVLAAALEMKDLKMTVILSGGTDGTDGPTDAAGALADGNTIRRSWMKGMDPAAYLDRNDSYNFFLKLGDLLITGPTRTNVMDLRIIILG